MELVNPKVAVRELSEASGPASLPIRGAAMDVMHRVDQVILTAV